MAKFQLGDLLRVMDNPRHANSFRDIIIDFLNERTHQYCGKVVRDVCLGCDAVKACSQVGLVACVAMEGCLKKDWENRLHKVQVIEDDLEFENEDRHFRPQDGVGGYERGE